jgi:hypothetical protein
MFVAGGVMIFAAGFVIGGAWLTWLWIRAVYVDALESTCERECALAAGRKCLANQ